MAYDAYKVTKAFERLFRVCRLPLTNPNDPKEAETVAAMYYEACEGYTTGAIVDACEDFTFGRVEGINRTWAPNVAQFATHLRSVQSHLSGTKSLHNAAVKQIALRDHDAEVEAARTPEAMARVKRLMEECVEKITPTKRTAAEIAQAKAHLGKLDIHFQSQFSEPIEGVRISTTLLRKLSTFNSADTDGMDAGEEL
jgi:hypothetical protein